MTISHLVATFVPEKYDISIDMQQAAERRFSATVVMHGALQSGAVIPVHAAGLTIESVTIDGHEASWTQPVADEVHMTHEGLVPGEHIVTISYSGTITDAMHGLYPCYYDHNGQKRELFATQCESHHARELVPCIDEPAAKAVFTLTLTTQPGLTVLGNMPVDWSREENGAVVTKFLPTPRMSSYLLAFVVGELHKKTAQTASGVEVNVWATPAQPDRVLDFALDVAVRSIDFFNEYFGVPYPLSKADHVALPDFSSGAMENWGLITYRESCLLADPEQTPEASKRFIATVIAHELSHQWFGNLVTMQWWDDLWLNESFASMMEYVAVDALFPQWRIWEEFAARDATAALRRDSLDGVQSVYAKVHHPDEIGTLFDPAIVYAKGGRLLVMVRQLIGEAAFRSGLKAYFEQFAYQNTVGDDLWRALEVASGQPIMSLMKTWISQPGLPVVMVQPEGGGVRLSQERFFIGDHQPPDSVWPIPLFAGEALPAMLTEQSMALPAMLTEQSMALPYVADIWLNQGMAGHFVTQYDEASRRRLLERAERGELSAIDTICLVQDMIALARAGRSSAASLVPLATALAATPHEKIFDLVATALVELRKFVDADDEARAALRQLSVVIGWPVLEVLGWDAQPGESDDDRERRSTALGMVLYGGDEAAVAEAARRFDAMPLHKLPAETRALIISAAVRHRETPAMIDQLLAEYKATASSDLEADIMAGLTATRSATTAERLLAAMMDASYIRPQDASQWFAMLIRAREHRGLALRWLCDQWSWIQHTFGGDKSYDQFVRYAGMSLITQEELDQFSAHFASYRQEPALARTIELAERETAARIALIAKDGAAVRQAIIEAMRRAG